MNNDTKSLVADLNAMIIKGQILEAFDKYYADDVVMQENNEDPRVGKAANRVYEEAFVNGVTKVDKMEVVNMAVEGDTAFVEWFMDITHKEWGRAARSQVAVQKWSNGKIVHEKFYYGK